MLVADEHCRSWFRVTRRDRLAVVGDLTEPVLWGEKCQCNHWWSRESTRIRQKYHFLILYIISMIQRQSTSLISSYSDVDR